MTNKNHILGFTLIELSIVLVIIGLLVGGVLVGQDLIEAANRRAVVKQIEQYELAVNTFKLKYNALSGDMNNASTVLNSSAINGNGNDILNADTEGFPFWQHLGFSNLIAGNYTGDLISGGAVPGQNVPVSAVYGGYISIPFDINSGPIYLGSDLTYTSININMGKDGNNPNSGSTIGGGGIISSQTAYLIDRKVDDGLADKGHWRGEAIDPNSGVLLDASCSSYSPSDNTTKCTFGYWFAP